MTTKVLIPIDGRHTSTAAEEYAVRLNKKMPIEVLVLNVINTHELDGHGINPDLLESVLATKKKFSEKAIAQSAGFFKERGIPVTRKILSGTPDKMICQTAVSEGCEMIVMAESSNPEAREWFIGKTTKGVLYQSQVPVLVVKHETEAAPGS